VWKSLADDLWEGEEVSEQILNGTSAQLGYTVTFTLVHTGKYRTADKLKKKQKLNATQKKQNNTKYSKTYWFSRLIRHSARKRAELILQHS